MPQQPQRPGPKRGRPARTQRQREAERERRIPPSYKGRLKFRPGDPHALDVQMREARNYRALLVESIAQLQAQLSALGEQDDPSATISAEENALKSFLWETYREHKHQDHIAATFLAIRRQRLLSRLEAAAAALEMAAELLRPDDRLLEELRAAVDHQRQESQRRKLQPRTQPPSSQQDQEPPALDHRHIYGDATATRAQLAAFDSQARTIRAALSEGTGWFEEFYVKKVRYTAQAREYLKRDEPIPADVQALEEVFYGPYLKYRWRETSSGPAYTIQMGLIPEGESAAPAEEEPDEDARAPWSTL